MHRAVWHYCLSYSHELSELFARQTLKIMQSGWYRRLFPKTQLDQTVNKVADFRTTRGGFRFTSSVKGTLTGRGAYHIIIDEPIKAGDAQSEALRNGCNEWFIETVMSRLNNKSKGTITLVMQRLHENDLSGRLLEENWPHLTLPAIATADEEFEVTGILGSMRVGRKAGDALHPSRDSLDALASLRKTMSSYIFSAQYQQQPVPAEGNIIRTAWLHYYKGEKIPASFDLIFQSWDTASKSTETNDYSVCTTWGVFQRRLYLLHVFRERLEFPALLRAMKSMSDAHNAETILIEDKSSGIQLIQQLQQDGYCNVTSVKPEGDKITRLIGRTPYFENGFVLLPENADWLADYTKELTSFPAGKHDDQVDSTTQAIGWFMGRQRHGIIDYYEQENASYELESE